MGSLINLASEANRFVLLLLMCEVVLFFCLLACLFLPVSHLKAESHFSFPRPMWVFFFSLNDFTHLKCCSSAVNEALIQVFWNLFWSISLLLLLHFIVLVYAACPGPTFQGMGGNTFWPAQSGRWKWPVLTFAKQGESRWGSPILFLTAPRMAHPISHCRQAGQGSHLISC